MKWELEVRDRVVVVVVDTDDVVEGAVVAGTDGADVVDAVDAGGKLGIDERRPAEADAAAAAAEVGGNALAWAGCSKMDKRDKIRDPVGRL